LALGYSSAAQYATERVGLSLSSIEHRMMLARRAISRPQLGRAVDAGVIGYEAALLVGRVVGRWSSDAIADAWIVRARRRTVRHLREEVAAVLTAVALRPDTSRLPPSSEDLEAVFAFQRKVQSGELLRSYYLASVQEPQTSVTFATSSGARRPLELKLSP